MKWAVVPCAILAVLLFNSGARADSCEVKLENNSVGVWQGQCRDGMPYGEGKLTYGGKTYEGVAEEEQNGLVRFRLDDDGREAGDRPSGQRRDGNEPQRQATGQGSQPGSGGSALAGGDRDKPAEDAEAGTPPPSDAARETDEFREDNAAGGDNADSRDRGEPAEEEDAWAPPASADRSPEPTAPVGAVTERPSGGGNTAAAPCKLDVKGKLHDWSGACSSDGKAYGQGSATAPDGTTYTGSAENGKRHGYGTVTTPDGGWFQGDYRDGVAHGDGTFRAPDGKYYKARFENGEQVGERVPVEYASLGEGEPDDAGNTGGGAADSERWNDSTGSVEDESWDPGAAADGSDPAPAGDGSGAGDPAYVAALEKLEGRGNTGSAASDDEYVAAIGQLERREAARRMAAQRAVERDAERLRDRIAREQSQKRAARSAAERQRRWAALDRKAERAAARLNRDMEAERARRSRKEARRRSEERRRRSEERRRRSKALLDRNLKIARLRRTLNEGISYCNSSARRSLNAALANCRNRLVWCKVKGCSRAKSVRCENSVRSSASRERSRCEAHVRSAYRRSAAALLAQKY